LNQLPHLFPETPDRRGRGVTHADPLFVCHTPKAGIGRLMLSLLLMEFVKGFQKTGP